MLSRYKTWTEEWRKTAGTSKRQNKGDTKQEELTQTDKKESTSLCSLITTDLQGAQDPPPIPRTHVNPKVIRDKVINHTLLAEACDRARMAWVIGTGAEMATTSMKNLGLEAPLTTKSTDEDEYWQHQDDAPSLATLLMRLQKKTHDQRQVETPEWMIIPLTHQLFQTQASKEQLHTAIKSGKALNSKAPICLWTTLVPEVLPMATATVAEFKFRVA
jgi:hypothetical protein